MTDSRRIAGLVGPTITALILSENEFMNPHLYDLQIPPVVYLSGTLIFIAGLSIVRVHNRWSAGWPVLVTLTGWFCICLGLFRMFVPEVYEQGAKGNPTAVLAGEALLLGVGVLLTYKAYARPTAPSPE